jgi:hypothetical protein
MAADPNWAPMVTEVTTFIGTYDIVIFAAAVVGLIGWGASKLLKSGR